jgi:predicted transcriptional regulator
MTTRQIAEAVGKPEQTVRNWVRRLASKMDAVKAKLDVSSPSKPADYDLNETCLIIETGLGKNAASLFRENASHSAPALDQSGIASIVRETMMAMVPALIAVLRGTVPEATLPALPEAPELTQRDQLRRIINRMVKDGDHAIAWRELYAQYYYRYHVNLRERAKHRGMDTLEYAEAEGLMPDLLALAVRLYGAAA